jgi:SAM-dependent methyltransferase
MSTDRKSGDDVVRSAKKTWDDLGSVDPLWAVLTRRESRSGKWDVDEFFETGTKEIDALMQRAAAFNLPFRRRSALDFGCGVGRLTRALATNFEYAVGVDVSTPMIEEARRLNRDVPGRITFEVNASADLRRFESGSFDLVYSRLVLQHVPSRDLVKRYIAEFVRVLAPGGLAVFQAIEHVPLRKRIQSHRRLYPFLRAIGFSPEYLLNTLGLQPMAMIAVTESEVRGTVTAAGGVVLAAEPDGSGVTVPSRMYYVAKNWSQRPLNG